MPSNLRFLAWASALTLALGGCNNVAPVPAGKTAGAQVLPGTISDSMIDLDQSQSHPLLNPDQSKHATVGEIMGEDASDAAKDTVAPDAAADADKPTPKATPTD